jgi:hypothetical protein
MAFWPVHPQQAAGVPRRSGPSLAAAAQQDLRLLAKVLAQGALQGLSQAEQAELQLQYRKQGLDMPQLVQQAQQEQQQGRQVWAGPPCLLQRAVC